MTEFIFKYWLEVVFGLIIIFLSGGYRRLAAKLKQSKTEQVAIKNGIQALLRNRIIHIYNDCMEKRYCPIYALENVESLHKEYKELGGNGVVDQLMDELLDLPKQREKRTEAT